MFSSVRTGLLYLAHIQITDAGLEENQRYKLVILVILVYILLIVQHLTVECVKSYRPESSLLAIQRCLDQILIVLLIVILNPNNINYYFN